MDRKKRAKMKRVGQRLLKPVNSLLEFKGVMYAATNDGLYYLKKNRWHRVKFTVNPEGE